MKSRILEYESIPDYKIFTNNLIEIDINKLSDVINKFSPDLMHCGDYFWSEDAFKPLSLMGHNWDYLNTKGMDFSTSFKATTDFVVLRKNIVNDYINNNNEYLDLLEILSLAYQIKRKGHKVQYINPNLLTNGNIISNNKVPSRGLLKDFVKINYSKRNHALFSFLYVLLR